MPWQDDIEQNELEGEPEVAAEIRRYLALADTALGRRQRPYLIERRESNLIDNRKTKHAA